MSFIAKLLLSLFLAVVIAYVAATIIGEERKARWFKKRTRFSILGKRGYIGDRLQFGYPRTVSGFLATVALLGVIAISTFGVFALL